jgi:hypothetical protein
MKLIVYDSRAQSRARLLFLESCTLQIWSKATWYQPKSYSGRYWSNLDEVGTFMPVFIKLVLRKTNHCWPIMVGIASNKVTKVPFRLMTSADVEYEQGDWNQYLFKATADAALHYCGIEHATHHFSITALQCSKNSLLVQRWSKSWGRRWQDMFQKLLWVFLHSIKNERGRCCFNWWYHQSQTHVSCQWQFYMALTGWWATMLSL